ncbi:MAG: serine hydrolase domain-containing protein [Steroidobacteraceae bacterium]
MSKLLAVAVASFLATNALGREIPSVPAEKEGFSTERLKRLDAKMHSYVDSGGTAGVITLIARHGRIVHFDVYGKADIEENRPLRADSLFRMFSMTKPITSVALLMLYEEGKFQLDDPLSKYFPEFKDVRVYVSGEGDRIQTEELKRAITVRDVFRHTAGFSGGTSVIAKLQSDARIFDGGLAELPARLSKLPLQYQPGTRWVYSAAHDMQAALVEKLSGQKFDDFVRKRILEPLDMKDSTLGIPAKDIDRFTSYYRFESGKLVLNDKRTDSTYKGVRGGSSLTSTARDYLRFAQMVANGGELDGVRILAPGTVKLMRSDQLPTDVWMQSPAGGTKYGLGVGVLVDPVARGNLGNKGEYGWSGAASTHYIADPEKDIVALFLTQKPDDRIYYREFITMVYQAFLE